MELIDLVNSIIIFSVSNYLTRMVNFPTELPDCVFHIAALLDLFICSDASICSIMAFLRVENFDYVVVSVSNDLPSNSQEDVMFCCTAYDYP